MGQRVKLTFKALHKGKDDFVSLLLLLRFMLKYIIF